MIFFVVRTTPDRFAGTTLEPSFVPVGSVPVKHTMRALPHDLVHLLLLVSVASPRTLQPVLAQESFRRIKRMPDRNSLRTMS